MKIMIIVLGVYLSGCIMAIMIQLLHLKLSAKRFGKIIIPNFKKFWIGYTIYALTSWIGFMILVVTMIIAWIKKVYR